MYQSSYPLGAAKVRKELLANDLHVADVAGEKHGIHHDERPSVEKV